MEIAPEGIVLLHAQNWTYTRLMIAFRSCFAKPPETLSERVKIRGSVINSMIRCKTRKETPTAVMILDQCAKTLSTIPNTLSTVPNTFSTIPNTLSTIPNTLSTIPNTLITIPNTLSTIPNTLITIPNTLSTIPNTLSTIP